MSNQSLSLLRTLAAAISPADGNPFLPDQLRFALELAPDGRKADSRIAQVRPILADLLQSDQFLLQALFSDQDAADALFLVLAFPGVERTLPPDVLFALAEELRIELGLISCEPDLGADVFVDPEPEPSGATESAVVDALCWVQGEAPPNKLWALENIRVPLAWQISPLKGQGIKVAQPDTGITDHTEISDARLRLADALNLMEGGTNPLDPLNPRAANGGHGTGTGSVLASGGTGQIVGAAPHAELIPIRCIDDVKVFDGTPVAKAIDHARRVGADVISMSLGGTPSRSVQKAIRAAVAADIIVVAAAGNCVPMVVWPARYDDVIAVGGSNIDDKKWKGSSSGGSVAISAPAELVWRAERKTRTDPPDKVSGGQGTSFATALTAGVAALWLAHFGRPAVQAQARARNVRVQDLFRAALRQTARRPPDWKTGSMGAGIVDAAALLSLPLAQIAVGSLSRASDAQAFGELLGTTQGPGHADEVFDWAAHGLEVASLVLADAKSGRGGDGAGRESRAFDRGASEGLVEAAQVSRDARLAALVLRSHRRTPVPRAAPLRNPLHNDWLIRRLGQRTEQGQAEAAAGGLSVESAQALLTPANRDLLMKSVQRQVAPELRASAESTLARLEAGIEQLHAHGVDAQLPPSETIGLEALVKLTERPALSVVDKGAEEPGQQTVRLDQVHDLGAFAGLLQIGLPLIERSLVSVGRIDAGGSHAGTGFVVGPDLILTNRHVLETLASPLPQARAPTSWMLTRSASIDFSPRANDPARRFRIAEVVFAGPDPILRMRFDPSHVDLALLRVDSRSSTGQALPPPLSLSTLANLLEEPNLVVCGYPAAPQRLPTTAEGRVRTDVVERLREIFGLNYGRKYLSPGLVEQLINPIAFEHDATTLPGSSGSCVIRLGEGTPVIGLHFAGEWLEGNYAHDLLALRNSGRAPPLAGLSWL